jgi:serine phosphatase RsbU (regulator of sigma subunit)
VLERRTAALLSLQTIGQALISSNDLGDLAGRVCRHVGELCGAERCALYLLNDDGGAAIIAVSGWDAGYLGVQVDGAALRADSSEPSSHHGWPPGIPERHADVAGAELRAGLCVPLMAEGRQLGMLIIHTTRRARFEPGEIALLQTFAHQAALSIQRTRLIDQLQDNIAQLHAAQAALVEQQRLAREMELAAEVQRSILPHVFPAIPGLSFAAENRPARQVGGDFYDVFMLDEATVGLVIADVSGKGMPAALYMALTRSLLLAEARRERSPRAVLLNVNRLLREVGDPHMFVTVFYGLFAAPSRQLTFARAGHDYPLLFRGGGAVEQLTGKGTVLGMLDLEAAQLTEEGLTLGPGDRLVLYTDGLTDVFNEANERLELPRLQAILAEQRAATPDEICENTLAALSAFQGRAEQFDDMTIVVVGVE